MQLVFAEHIVSERFFLDSVTYVLLHYITMVDVLFRAVITKINVVNSTLV